MEYKIFLQRKAIPNKHIPYPMVLNGIFIGMIGIREDQKDYFGIPDPTPDEQGLMLYLGTVKAHKRNIFSEKLKDETPNRQKSIEKNNVERVRKKITNSRGGKPVKIPTELTSTPVQTSTDPHALPKRPSIRFTTIKFPGAASNAEISRWLNIKLVLHKPKYFKTPSGVDYPIIAGATSETI